MNPSPITDRVYPELVDKATAESEMQGLSFTGTMTKGK